MVTVSSAFISSRRERIIFSVLSASGCAFKAAACVDVLRVVLPDLPGASLGTLGKTDLDLDNTDVARDHSFHCIANAESWRPLTILGMWGYWFQYSSEPRLPVRNRLSLLCLPAPVRVPKARRRQVQLHAGEENPGRSPLI